MLHNIKHPCLYGQGCNALATGIHVPWGWEVGSLSIHGSIGPHEYSIGLGSGELGGQANAFGFLHIP